MNKRKVMYYVQPYYLDCCIEIIQELMEIVELHLIIEVSPDSKNATIIEFDNLDKYKAIEELHKVIKKSSLEKLNYYVSGCKAVKLLIFNNKSAFSPSSLFTGLELANYIRKNKIDTIHFDGQSARLIYILPFIAKKNIFLTIHDPVQHSGERHWKTDWIRNIYIKITTKIFFYSDFALGQYLNINSKQKKKISSIRLKPYTFISKFETPKIKKEEYILFFGRISYYKGIDILINSIKIVLLTYPNEIFLIVGDFGDNKNLYENIKDNKNLEVINKHIEIQELAEIISKSKFVVCPYRDATQSGVLMTSFAMKKPVIASNVGAFPEYIEHDKNGLLSNPNHIDFAEQIIYALRNERYKLYESNLRYNPNMSNNKKSRLISEYEF
jgi:glycosyltransferase involved in cell wall biosynthesis